MWTYNNSSRSYWPSTHFRTDSLALDPVKFYNNKQWNIFKSITASCLMTLPLPFSFASSISPGLPIFVLSHCLKMPKSCYFLNIFYSLCQEFYETKKNMQQNTSLLLNYHHNFILLTRFASLMVRCNKHVRPISPTLSSAAMMFSSGCT